MRTELSDSPVVTSGAKKPVSAVSFLKRLVGKGAEPSACVHTEMLHCPSDDLRRGRLWRRQSVMAGSQDLKQLVERATYLCGNQRFVHDSVVVEVSEDTLTLDRRAGGSLGSELARTLAQHHDQDFGDKMAGGRRARYRVVPASDLSPDHVRVRLGLAVHVPEEGERVAWQLQVSHDGQAWDECPSFDIVERQRLSILAGDASTGTLVMADWPFDMRTGLVLLNEPGATQLELSTEPLNRLVVSRNDKANWYVLREPDASAQAPCLYLRVQRQALPAIAIESSEAAVDMPIPMPAPVPPVTKVVVARIEPSLGTGPLPAMQGGVQQVAPVQPVLAAQAIDADNAPTLVATEQQIASNETGDNAPTLVANPLVRPPQLALVGLVLQRPSLFGGQGVTGLSWGVDAKGRIVAAEQPQAALRFELTMQDELRLLTRSGPRVLPLGESVPLPGGETVLQLQALPAPMTKTAMGWLSLPPVARALLTLGEEREVGRQAEGLKVLRPLAARGHLPDLPDLGGDCMGLSRHHASLKLTAEGLAVKALEQATLTHLDADMNHLATVTAQQPALLADGHYLALGHYLWRFTA